MKLLRIALVLAVLLILTISAASADSPPEIGPAMFRDYPNCRIFDVDFNWYFIEGCNPTISLVTNSKTGLILWTAKAQLPDEAVLPDLGAHIVTYENSGFACWFQGQLTTNYSILITPDGEFIASCHFRPDKWQPD